MTRRTATTALTAVIIALTPAAALAQVPGGPPPPPPQPPALPPVVVSTPTTNHALMAAEIRKRMTDNAFGWQFAIGHKGNFVVADKGGWARSNADTPSNKGPLAMKPTMRYEIASLTKNTTAVATLKLLRAHGLTVHSSIDPWLPKSWKRGPGFKSKSVKFRHLLSHRSGINQMLAALPPNTSGPGNSWDGVRWIVERGTKPGSPRQYKNANYALLRVTNGLMWRTLGGKLGGKSLAFTENTHASYAMDHLRRKVLAPVGIKSAGCAGGSETKSGLNYPSGAKQSTKGALLEASVLGCAGHMGLRLSAIEIVRYLAHLRHGAIIHPADLAMMDGLRLGWWEDSNGADGDQFGTKDGKPDNALSPGVFWHPGDLLGTNQVHTCGMTFADGTEASMIANSPLVSDSTCGVLIKAWNVAK